MIVRVEPPVRNVWTRAAVALFAENLSVSYLNTHLAIPCTTGTVLLPEASQAFFNAEGLVTYWMVKSGRDPGEPAEAHCEDLLTLLTPSRGALRALLADGAIGELNVCVMGADFAVPFSLSHDVVGRIADLGLRLRVFFTGEKRWLALSASLDFGSLGESAR